jgi:predicted nucleotide-binding protein (sugar kinase/HSP70/actin superfamily)
MPIKIGLPRALTYHEFGDLWCDFFKYLDTPYIVSAETNRRILDQGTKLAVDESCLPLKLYLGHVQALIPQCDMLFVPRIARYNRNFFFCAKFAGLPDIIRNTFRLSPQQLVSPNIDSNFGYHLGAVATTANAVGRPATAGYAAFRKALSNRRKSKLTCENHDHKPIIGIVGHSYLLKDKFLCDDIYSILQSRNATLITPHQLAAKMLYDEAQKIAPAVYWQLSAKLTGAAVHFAQRPDISGIILVSSFGCGPDSLTNEYIEHQILRPSNKPYLIVNLDEHTGRAGLITRIEAFWDLVEWRLKKA